MTETAWTPPENPDPSAILHSAVDDRRHGLFEQSLAKFVWYHHHALEHKPTQSGVRLSFALGYWLELARKYPPAHDAFIRARDDTEQAFRQNPSDVNLFRYLAAMNYQLGDGMRTADLFLAAASQIQGHAQPLYRVAEPYLVAAGQFSACAPFLEPTTRMEHAAESYHRLKTAEESRPNVRFPIPEVARAHYIRNVATLVGLLVLNDRIDAARTAYNEALAILPDDEFRAILDAALSGHLPEQHPR